MRAKFFALIIALPSIGFALSAEERQQVEERIRPIGQVHVAPQQISSVQPASASQEPGQAIYDKYCSVCHRDGIAGAPKFRDKAEWQPRLEKKKLEELIATVNTGLNGMPPKGTCIQCNDEDIKNAIQYMLPRT